MPCGAAYNIVTRTEFRVLRSFGERQHLRAASLLPVHRGNTQLKTTLQSGGGCSRPQNCGAAVLKRRPTSVLPPCFSPRYTTRQSCSSRLATFRKISLSPILTDSDKVMRQP